MQKRHPIGCLFPAPSKLNKAKGEKETKTKEYGQALDLLVLPS